MKSFTARTQKIGTVSDEGMIPNKAAKVSLQLENDLVRRNRMLRL